MRRMTSRGLMALENEDQLPVESDALGEAADSLETDLIDVVEEEADAAEHEAQIDEAIETAEALESIADSLESIAQNGGLDKNGAIVLNLGLEHMYSRLGMGGRKGVAALESFGGTSSRVGATTISMEDIREQAKKIWDAIVAQIKKAIAWVQERFTKIFGAANKLEARAKAVAEKAGNTSGNAKEKTFENERLVKALHIGGAVPKTIGNNANEMKEVAASVFGQITTWNGDAGDKIVEAMDDPKKAADFTMPAMPSVPHATDGGADFGDAGTGMKFVRSKELPGGQAVIGRIPAGEAKGVEGLELLSRMTFNVGKANPKAKEPSKSAVETLAPSEAEKVATAVAGVAEEIQSYKKSMEKLKKTKERIVQAAEKAGKNSANSEGDDRAAYKALQKLGSAVTKIIDQPAGAYSVYALNTGKALLDYCELSLKQYAE